MIAYINLYICFGFLGFDTAHRPLDKTADDLADSHLNAAEYGLCVGND